MNHSRDESVAFYIGEDLAYHGLSLPEDASLAMQRGYEVECIQRRGVHPADRFERKWLQLRVGAWRRGKVFNSDVTPQFLATLDTGVCPVSQAPLTYGTRQESDWSVDRLDNDAGYARLNLVVLSSRVNSLKGRLTPREVVDIALKNEDCAGLTRLEWRRLAWLCAGLLDDLKALVRACSLPRALMVQGGGCSGHFQEFLIFVTQWPAASRKELLDDLIAHGSPAAARAFSTLTALLASYCRVTPASQRNAADFFADEEHWAAFSAWFHAFSRSPRAEKSMPEWADMMHRAGMRGMSAAATRQELALSVLA